ncbi:MAG TPA: SGNH/GDSL hydrolase family protein [Polyangiales bacterium]
MFVRALLTLALALCGLSCQRSSQPGLVYPDNPDLHYVGWFDRSVPTAPRAAWAGSQITARFTGTSIRAYLSDRPVDDRLRERDRITVLIDDQPAKTFALAEGRHTYWLARGLGSGTHEVTIWKRTEPEVGVIMFHGLRLDPDAALTPSPSAARRMVFIGDSITAGYGNEGDSPACHWSAASENNYETYGARAARELSADYLAMAWSGKGVTRNFYAEDKPTLPELWDLVIPTEAGSPRVPRTKVDVVVVNLGTNDVFRGLPDADTFVSMYAALLSALRGHFGKDALIVLALGPMLADDSPQPQARSTMREWLAAARALRAQAGDTKLEFIEFWFDPKEGAGCDWHPNLKTHARLGQELAELLRARMKW